MFGGLLSEVGGLGRRGLLAFDPDFASGEIVEGFPVDEGLSADEAVDAVRDAVDGCDEEFDAFDGGFAVTDFIGIDGADDLAAAGCGFHGEAEFFDGGLVEDGLAVAVVDEEFGLFAVDLEGDDEVSFLHFGGEGDEAFGGEDFRGVECGEAEFFVFG